MIYTLLLTPGGGYFWEFLVGVCHLVLQILTLFQTKKCHFPVVVVVLLKQWESDGGTVLWNSGTVIVEQWGGTMEQ